MGAIVTVKVPRGTDVNAVKEQIRSKIEAKTGESVTVAVNIVQTSQIPNVGNNSFIPQNSLSLNPGDYRGNN